jgi:hypothetical protein
MSRKPYAFMLLAAWVAAGAAQAQSDTPVLSKVQQQKIDKAIAALKYPQERALANAWSPAKKVAEILCRPAALRALRRKDASADKVILGDESKDSLRLVSNRLLEGKGSVRNGSGWRDMSFTCELDPATGTVVGFTSKRA